MSKRGEGDRFFRNDVKGKVLGLDRGQETHEELPIGYRQI